MSISAIAALLGVFLLVLFAVTCFATGLYYLAELVEEHCVFTGKLIRIAIKAEFAIHLLLFVVDGLPFFCVACGLAVNLIYYRLLKTFPYVNLSSYDFLGGLGLLVLNHFLWFKFFLHDLRASYASIEWMTGFMAAVVWVVPFMYFLSMAANDYVLPTSSMTSYQSEVHKGASISADGHSSQPARRSRGAFLSLFTFLRHKRDEVLPQFMGETSFGKGKHF